MLKNFLLKKVLETKLKDVPQAQKEKILKLFEENPELLQKIAKEMQEKVKGGKDQMAVAQELMQKYGDELKGIL